MKSTWGKGERERGGEKGRGGGGEEKGRRRRRRREGGWGGHVQMAQSGKIEEC